MRLIVIGLLCAAVWYGYGFWKSGKVHIPSRGGELVLFTSDVCHQPCDDARALLKELPVSVEEVLVTNNDPESWKRLESVKGGDVAPLLITRTGRVAGFHREEYLSAIGDSEGLDVLPPDAREILASHFDNGTPKLVMYGTAWCPNCARARAYFSQRGLSYEERDVEQSSLDAERYRWFNSSGYPLIYYGAKRIQGFNQEKLEQLVNSIR